MEKDNTPCGCMGKPVTPKTALEQVAELLAAAEERKRKEENVAVQKT